MSLAARRVKVSSRTGWPEHPEHHAATPPAPPASASSRCPPRPAPAVARPGASPPAAARCSVRPARRSSSNMHMNITRPTPPNRTPRRPQPARSAAFRQRVWATGGRHRHADGGQSSGPQRPAGPQPSPLPTQRWYALMTLCIGMFVLSCAVLDRTSTLATVIVSRSRWWSTVRRSSRRGQPSPPPSVLSSPVARLARRHRAGTMTRARAASLRYGSGGSAGRLGPTTPGPPGGLALSCSTSRRVLDGRSRWMAADGTIEVLADDYGSSATRTRPSTRSFRPLRSPGRGQAGPEDPPMRSSRRWPRACAVGPARGGLVGFVRDPADGHRGDTARPGRQADRRGADPGPRAGRRPAGPGRPRDVSVELVTDERTFRAASRVAVRGWGRRDPDRRRVRPRVHRDDPGPPDLVQLPRGGHDRLRARLVRRVHAAWRGGPAVGCGHPPGVPAARQLPGVLAERLRLAREHGVALALVKGRVETSGPILLRAGFADYGQERCYWLPISSYRGTLLNVQGSLPPGQVLDIEIVHSCGHVVMHP